MVPSNSTRGSGQALMQGKFHPNMRKNFFSAVATHGNKLPREGVEYPSVEILERETISCAVCSRMILPGKVGLNEPLWSLPT